MVCAKDYIYYPDIVLILVATRSALVLLSLSVFFLLNWILLLSINLVCMNFYLMKILLMHGKKQIILKVLIFCIFKNFVNLTFEFNVWFFLESTSLSMTWLG